MRRWDRSALPEPTRFWTWNICGGLLAAAVTAVFLTTFVAMSGIIVADVVNGASTDKLLEIVNPLGWLLVLVFSICFGLLGAAVFLSIAFWLCFRSGGGTGAYAWAGLLAGAVYASIGIVLRTALGLELTGSVVDQVLVWGGGFLLAFWPRPETVFFLMPASMISGWLSGRTFARLSRSALALA